MGPKVKARASAKASAAELARIEVRVGVETMGVNALKDTMQIAKRQPCPMKKAFEEGEALIPLLFSKENSLLRRQFESARVRFYRDLADAETARHADAAIGIVSVGANWVASDLVAGAQDKGATGFGVGDTSQTVNNTGLIARIASIAIKGVVQGTVAGGDHFGFVAEQIGKLSVGGKAIALTTGPGNDDVLIPSSLDVRLLEVTTPPI